MICLREVKRFCKEYYLIENYDQAIVDTTQTWHCHHRFEIEYNLSKIELQAMGFYFDRPFDELIFLTPKEHHSLHHKGQEGYWNGRVGPNKGKQFTEEAKAKMSNSKKGENNPMYGKEGENSPNYKYHIIEEELYDLYIAQDLSIPKIAKMYGCTSQCIWNKLKKYNIKK